MSSLLWRATRARSAEAKVVCDFGVGFVASTTGFVVTFNLDFIGNRTGSLICHISLKSTPRNVTVRVFLNLFRMRWEDWLSDGVITDLKKQNATQCEKAAVTGGADEDDITTAVCSFNNSCRWISAKKKW
jgi:hypothetical protein